MHGSCSLNVIILKNNTLYYFVASFNNNNQPHNAVFSMTALFDRNEIIALNILKTDSELLFI